MQKYKQKKRILFSTICLLCFSLSSIQAQENKLEVADSLFKKNDLKQAAEIYSSELTANKNLNLPIIFLKLSYCYSSLADYPKAIYYLQKAYFVNPKYLILAKINEIANEQNYEGYNNTEFNYLFSIYLRYYNIIILFSLILGGYFLYFLYRRRRYLKIRHLVFFGTYCFFLLIIINSVDKIKIGIVKSEYAYLRTIPSASKSPELTLNNGHKLYIFGEKDIWQETIVEKQIFYIKKTDIYLAD